MTDPLETTDAPGFGPEPLAPPPANIASDSGVATVILRDETGRLLPGHRMGRPKGARNRETKAIREAFLEALDRLGGSRWLAKFARRNPEVFVPCLARMLPKEIAPNPEEEDVIDKLARKLDALKDRREDRAAAGGEAESCEP